MAEETASSLRLISLSQDIGGRAVRARGYVVLAPSPAPPAAELRSGAGARVFTRPGLAVLAVDMDGAGAAIVSGAAPAQSPVSLTIDGSDAGEGRTDVHGRFAMNAPEPLNPGNHTVSVRTASGAAVAFAFTVSRDGAVTPPFVASRGDGYTRIDWFTPGGGVQTTLLADTPGAGG